MSKNVYYKAGTGNIKTCTTVKEALQASGLDWKVTKYPIKVENDTYPSWFAVKPENQKTIFGVVKGKYKIVQNEEAFDIINNISNHASFHSAGTFRNGAQVWMNMKLRESFKILDDKFNVFLTFTNSHDGKGAVRVGFMPMREVCSNGLNLILPNSTREYSFRHFGDVQKKLSIAKEILNLNEKYINNLHNEAEILQQIKLNENKIDKLIADLIPISDSETELIINRKIEERDKIKACIYADDLQKFGLTAWTYINAVSDYMSHKEPIRKTETFYQGHLQKMIESKKSLINVAYNSVQKLVA